jgi:hypothetical protein
LLFAGCTYFFGLLATFLSEVLAEVFFEITLSYFLGCSFIGLTLNPASFLTLFSTFYVTGLTLFNPIKGYCDFDLVTD